MAGAPIQSDENGIQQGAVHISIKFIKFVFVHEGAQGINRVVVSG